MEDHSYVILGTSPWEAPWLTEQNLAHVLAKRVPVLYVEPPITPLTPLRYGLRPQSRAQARLLLQRRPRRTGQVNVFQPLVLPPRSDPRARELSRPLLRRQIKGAAAAAGIRRPVVVSAHATPGAFDALDAICRIYLVKDWIEAGGELLGRDPAVLARERDAMCAAADVVCAISQELVDTLGERSVDAQLLRHGFQADLVNLYDDAPCPPEYAGLPRPLLGYAGRIDARLDYDALAALADRFSGGTLLFVGPVSPRLPAEQLQRLTSMPNVRLLGPYGREQLPAYLAHLDCALMPYRVGEWARHGSPLKLWDYLYAGPPIVGSGYSVLREYPRPLVHYADGPGALVREVEDALEEAGDGSAQRRATALANSWDERASELEAIVRGCVGG